MNFQNGWRWIVLVANCFVLCLFASGCGVSMPSRLALPDIPKTATAPVIKMGEMPPLVFVEEFSDVRDDGALAFYESRSVQPAINMIGAQVTDALGRELDALGFEVTDAAPLLVRGEVRVWKAHIAGGMPAFVSGEAVFGIKVLDPANRPIYLGTYRGYANLEDSSVDSQDVRKVLGTAMSEALKQFVKDRKLMALLSSF